MSRNLFIFLFVIMGLKSEAILTTSESTELTPEGQYKVGVEPQIILSSGAGFNLTGFFDRAINESSSFRASVGFGDTDFVGGLSYKWIPYPDYNEQPGMGLKIEGLYGREGNESILALRLHPLISKKYQTEHGLFIPYGSLPIGTYSYASRSDFQAQLVAGSEFISPKYTQWQFGAELGVNASKSISYISGYVVYLFDSDSLVSNRDLKKKKR